MMSISGKLPIGLAVASALVGAAINSAPASAEGYLQPLMEGRTNAHRNVAGNDIEAMVVTLRESNRMVIDVEMERRSSCTNVTMACLNFHLVSAPNTANRKWDILLGKDQAAYSKKWKRNSDRGFRPTDIETQTLYANNPGGRGGQIAILYSGLWTENTEKFAWASFSKISSDKFREEFAKRVTNGDMVMVDHDRSGKDGREHAVIFVKPKGDRNVRSYPSVSRSAYNSMATAAYGQNKRWPLYILPGNTMRVSLIRDDRREARVFSALNDTQFRNRLGAARDDGFELIDLERDGDKWAAVFLRPRRAVRANPD